MFCKKCGEKIDDDSVYCRFCGVNQTVDTSVKSNDDKTESAVKKQIVEESRSSENNVNESEIEDEILEEENTSEEIEPKEIKEEKSAKSLSELVQDLRNTKLPSYERTTENTDIVIVGVITIIAFWILAIGANDWFDTKTHQAFLITSVVVKIVFTAWIVNTSKTLNRDAWLWGVLGFFLTGIIMVVIGLLPRSLKSKHFYENCYQDGGKALISGNYDKAINSYMRCLAVGYGNKMYLYYNLACAFSSNNDPEKANESLALALKNGFCNYTGIEKDKQLEKLRDSSIFKETKRTYFPNQN